jgi:Ca2+-binding EF-hand superfamily protein
MPGDVKNQKFHIIFDWFDQGKDGYLDGEDFQQMAALFSSLPSGERPENQQALQDAFAKWWQVIVDSGDTDADGRIGRDEFITVMKTSVTAPANFETAVLAIADAFMRIVDTGGDGSLSFDDYVRMYTGLGIDPRHSSEAFKRLDRDGDNMLGYDEFRTAITEFYLSEDPDAPGNWLLGPPS